MREWCLVLDSKMFFLSKQSRFSINPFLVRLPCVYTVNMCVCPTLTTLKKWIRMSHRPETVIKPDIYKIRTHANVGQRKYSILPFMILILLLWQYLPLANDVWSKVMFLHLSVILWGSVSNHAIGRGYVSQHAMGQGMRTPACNWAGGVYPGRGYLPRGCVCLEDHRNGRHASYRNAFWFWWALFNNV